MLIANILIWVNLRSEKIVSRYFNLSFSDYQHGRASFGNFALQ